MSEPTFTVNKTVVIEEAGRQLTAYAADLRKLVADHQNGRHPYGSMRRDCPLCVESRIGPASPGWGR